jgi:SAM-dependent methyltransferase
MRMTKCDPTKWIEQHLDVRAASYGAFFYARIEQWSPGRLPGINCTFDPGNKTHFGLKAAELDFAITVGRGRILDFGPGDGWPALRIAPMIESVVGVEASAQRVETCRRNARHLKAGNAEFVLVEPGDPLPFDDESFDGAVASWSLEETPDLEVTLRELFRVLRPGAKLRFERVPMSFFSSMEGIGMYVGDALGSRTIVLIGDPDTREQKVRFHGLLVDLPRKDFLAILERHGSEPGHAALTDEVLSELRPSISEAGTWATRNPDCATWLKWLQELGFRYAQTTYSGGWVAERFFDRLPESRRPTSEEDVAALLRPLVEVAVTMEAPKGLDAPITAVK